MSTPDRFRLVKKLVDGTYVPITDEDLGGVTPAELEAATENRAIVDEDGALRNPADGSLLPVVSGSGPAGYPTNPVTDASAARPSLTVVYWKCATQPANLANGDVWRTT